MDRADAEALARDIVETWQLTASIRIWIDALGPMDRQIARQTYVELRRSWSERGISIGQFSDEYKRRKPPPPVEEFDCRVCPGDGWITETVTHKDRAYRAVRPCRCPAGKANQHAHHRVLERSALNVDDPQDELELTP